MHKWFTAVCKCVTLTSKVFTHLMQTLAYKLHLFYSECSLKLKDAPYPPLFCGTYYITIATRVRNQLVWSTCHAISSPQFLN